MLGSDHPFTIGDPEPLRIVNETRLAPAERQAILGETAARLFHVSCGCAE
jgi:predicted TIM-barrel fold metal-dependent hydrolase